MALRLGAIVEALGGELHGDPDTWIVALAPLETAGPETLSFLSHPKYRGLLAGSQAACVIVSPDHQVQARERGSCIVVAQPYLYFSRLTRLWKSATQRPLRHRIHPSAVIDPEARVHASAIVGALCVIERGATIGSHTELRSRVTVAEDCHIGERCLLHPGVVIGADGFGFAPNNGVWEKIEQLGAVRIGHDTIISDGVKLDNLVQIGHNVQIGAHSALAGCVGVAGSARIGAHCTLGGGAIVLGHLELADHVHISAASVVTRSIRKPGNYTGFFPIDDNPTWEKNAASLKQLNGLRERVRSLEQKFDNKEPP